MRILLAVDHQSDPVALGNYLLHRIGGRPADIEVITVIPGIQEPFTDKDEPRRPIISIGESSSGYRQRCALVAAIAAQLQASGFASVRTHVEYGEPAEVLLESSRQWRCELVLLSAPRGKGRLTALQLDGVTRRLLNWSDSPVELMRPFTGDSVRRNTVLMPVPLHAIKRFPLHALQALPWWHGSRLHLLGIQPESIDTSRAEANPAALLLALQHARDAGAKAKTTLAACAKELDAACDGKLQITHGMVEGNLHQASAAAIRSLQPQVLVLSQACFDQNPKALFGGLTPAALALSAPCSVLLLQDDPGAATTMRRRDPAPILKLAR
jgi:nucleotide-binding universal stress UspA family protein